MGYFQHCLVCGTRFVAQRSTRRYCSDECRNDFHRAFWNDPSDGKLAPLLRQVAETLDHGKAVRSQVTRLRALLGAYDRSMMAQDVARYYSPKKSRKKKSA